MRFSGVPTTSATGGRFFIQRSFFFFFFLVLITDEFEKIVKEKKIYSRLVESQEKKKIKYKVEKKIMIAGSFEEGVGILKPLSFMYV